jgi:hypothetical protein
MHILRYEPQLFEFKRDDLKYHLQTLERRKDETSNNDGNCLFIGNRSSLGFVIRTSDLIFINQLACV